MTPGFLLEGKGHACTAELSWRQRRHQQSNPVLLFRWRMHAAAGCQVSQMKGKKKKNLTDRSSRVASSRCSVTSLRSYRDAGHCGRDNGPGGEGGSARLWVAQSGRPMHDLTLASPKQQHLGLRAVERGSPRTSFVKQSQETCHEKKKSFEVR